jgi:hypothetical protein
MWVLAAVLGRFSSSFRRSSIAASADASDLVSLVTSALAAVAWWLCHSDQTQLHECRGEVGVAEDGLGLAEIAGGVIDGAGEAAPEIVEA